MSKTAEETTTEARAKPAFKKIVHAYRRLPHMAGEPPKEQSVEVVAANERIKFHSNEAGHVVATVLTKAAYERLTKEIPEAYIEYQGGTNIPERPSAAAESAKPEGKYVLTNGKDSVVLDAMTDEQVREFAAGIGLEEDALPPSLEGDTLKQAVVNTLR